MALLNKTRAVVLLLLLSSAVSAGNSEPGLIWVNASGNSVQSDDVLGVYRPKKEGETAAETSRGFRVEIDRSQVSSASNEIEIISRDKETNLVRHRLQFSVQSQKKGNFTTPWIIAVVNFDDTLMPFLAGNALWVSLGDVVEARWVTPRGKIIRSFRRVSSARGSGPMAVKRIQLRIGVVRNASNGKLAIGQSHSEAVQIMRYQVAVLNEVLSQCYIWAGAPEQADVDVIDTRDANVLVVGETLGLLSRGGLFRVVIDGQRIGPIKMPGGKTPVELAHVIAGVLVEKGYRATVSTNSHDLSKAYASADIIVKRIDGGLVRMTQWAWFPLLDGPNPSVTLGYVDLDDGLTPYTLNGIATFSPEQRALLRLMGPSANLQSIDVLIVNRFLVPGKQGMSFLRSPVSKLGPAVVLDGKAIVNGRQSYTLAHEVGHLLLEDLGHPDDKDDNRTFLLMNSSSSGAVQGPLRITDEQCMRMRQNLD